MSSCSVPSSRGFLDYLDENRFFSLLTTTTFVIIGTFLYIVSLYKYFERESIPNIFQPFAPYGNLQDVLDKYTTFYELISKYYKKMKKKSYKYVGMYLFFKPCVVVLDTSLISEIVLNSKQFVDVNRIEINFKETLNSEVINGYLKMSNSFVEPFINSLKNSEGIFQIKLHNFICELLNTIFGLEKTELTMRLLKEAERQQTCSSFKYYFKMVYPYFGANSHHVWNKVIKEQILFRKKNDSRKPDILQNITDASGIDYSSSDSLLEDYIDRFVETIIFSYYSSLFCLFELSRNVDIQEELIGEIRRFNNSGKNVCDLPYLEAVVKETLRKYPPVPVVLKKCKENYESKVGYIFQKGNWVLLPAYAVHHDADIYVDPENFDPDRFLEDNIEKCNTFLPFGMIYVDDYKEFQISVPIIKFIMVCILSNFKVKLSDKNYYLNFDSTKLNIQPAKPIPFQIEPL